jgi:hypothetical protein
MMAQSPHPTAQSVRKENLRFLRRMQQRSLRTLDAQKAQRER